MAFIRANNTVLSFASFDDVQLADQRLLQENESLTEDTVEEALVRATNRVLSKLQTTDWWKNLFVNLSSTTVAAVDIPQPNPVNIIARQADFTELTVCLALSDYILPTVADFSNESNAELVKMKYYADRFNTLFDEIVTAGDWYDFNADGIITTDEKQRGIQLTKRIR